MKKQSSHAIVIIHFQPLELYPPVCNLLDYLVKNSKDKVIVITTEDKGNKKFPLYKNASKQIIIRRSSAIVPSSVLRLFRYFFFYLNSLRLLLKHQPGSVLYFDTISSWPALIYKKIKAKVRLLAHYHEYCSPQEYAANMFLVKTMHKQEIKMYSRSYHWISQTNEVRLHQMISDNHLVNTGHAVFHTMPNYPSRYWAQRKTNYGISEKIRLVYVGSLGYDTTYLKELTEWVVQNKNQFTLDLYSHNIDEKASAFLGSLQTDNVQFHGTVNYPELPEVLANYDVGLVIYKPVSDNWIQNAPNKVFEYLACGLDVWFSKTMTYAKKLSTEDTFPKIIPVDFENLDEFDFQKAINRSGLVHKESNFFYENVYDEILTAVNE